MNITIDDIKEYIRELEIEEALLTDSLESFNHEYNELVMLREWIKNSIEYFNRKLGEDNEN